MAAKSISKIVLILVVATIVYTHELKQMVILSRHNVRTPLSKQLLLITPKQWPHWKEKSGELTAKGALLEGFLGEYFSLWLKNEGLLQNTCPDEDTFFAYANNKQRTIASAVAFTSKAFPNCTISVHHASGDNKDPNFNPVIHNASETFREIARHEMIEKLSQVNVKIALCDLENILDYTNSNECKVNLKCDLANDKTNVGELVDGEEPEITGPLHIGNSAVDTFKMEYYSGLPMADVAWGQLTQPSKWNEFMKINEAYHNVRFNTTSIAKNIASPLIIYIRKLFNNYNAEQPKVSLLMGHDANLYSVLCSLDFKDYKLTNQNERTPVGGKLVFQKWWDDVNKIFLLKTQYIYQSTAQLRKATKLSLEVPPQIINMEMNGCSVDKDGFCMWDDFLKVLDGF